MKTFEKRIHPRKQIRTRIIFEDEFGEGLFYVWSEDVSMGGLFLASDIPIRLGSLIFLSFTLPHNKRPLKATGEVVRKSRSGEGSRLGMGIRFVGLSEATAKKLEEFLTF